MTREWHDNEDAGDASMMNAADASEYIERPRLDCGCDPDREYCDLCEMPDPR